VAVKQVAVKDTEGLGDARQAYLEAVHEGADELVVELPAGCLGLDPPGAMASVELTGSGSAAPLIDVTLRASGGLCVLAGMPITIVARNVTLEGVAVVGAPARAIGLVVTGEARMRDVTVMGSAASENDRAVVVVTAAAESAVLSVEGAVVAGCEGRDSVFGVYNAAAGWFDQVSLSELTVAGYRRAGALVDVHAARVLRASGCALDAGEADVLLRMMWPPAEGELASCLLAAGGDALVSVTGELPEPPPPLRLTGDSAVSAPLDALPDMLRPEDGVRQESAESVRAEIDARVQRAAERLVAVDARLERMLLP
jgi:hypothetical protein